MGKEDIKLKAYLEDARRYADLWNGSVFQNAGERMYMVRKTDKLYPIVTLIIYWGEEEWDGPRSLWEMIAFGEDGTSFGKELRRLIPEYSLHFLDLTRFEHFEYFKTELRPLLELYQKRNYKEKFIEYLKDYKNCMNMDDESWYLLSNLTHSKDIRRLIREKQRREGNDGMCRALEEWKADCKIEGKIEAKAEDIIELLEDYGEVSDELKSNIFLQNDLTLLKRWHKLAARAGSIEEFVCQINNNI